MKDKTYSCYQCGAPLVVNQDGTTNHLFSEGEAPEGTLDDTGVGPIDYDLDLDHVAVPDVDDRCPMKSDGCYYADPDVCEGELWTCQTCGQSFCEVHWHETDKGHNVECVGCERVRETLDELEETDEDEV